MWLLKNDAGNIYYIRGDQPVTVGRKKTDIVLLNDNSISKNHGTLRIKQDEKEIESRLFVKDSSKYGSSILIGDSTISLKENENELKHLNKVKFGLQQHVFTVIKIPINICISQLNVEDCSELEKLVKVIDANVFNKFRPDCTHLTTSKPTLTQKVIQALIANLPIVNINYWKHVLQAVDKNVELPDPALYILGMKDDSISREVSLSPQPDRKRLFLNLTFISFSERQYRHYTKIIEAAGGKINLYDIRNKNENINFTSEKVVVLQLQTDATQYNNDLTSKYTAISNFLARKNRRIVSETEVPLAILYCSIMQHCNPSYDFRKLLSSSQSRENALQKAPVLVEDTQDLLKSKPAKKFPTQSYEIIKETCEIVAETQSQSSSKASLGSNKTELRYPLQNKVKHNITQEIIISESPDQNDGAINSAGGTTNRSQSLKSAAAGSSKIANSSWKNHPSSTQISDDFESARSMQVECSTIKNREMDSLFTNADNQRLSLWEKAPKTEDSDKVMETQNSISKKRKRFDEESVDDMDIAETGSSAKEQTLPSKKQKTVERSLSNETASASILVTQDSIKTEEILDFDDWGLEDGLNENNVQEFGFVLNGNEQPKKKDKRPFEIQIEKRNPPRNIDKEKQSKTNNVADPSTSRKNYPENQNKRMADTALLDAVPEKRRKPNEEIKNQHSIEQVTRNIQSITVNENNFSLTKDSDFCNRYEKNQPLLRAGFERALEDTIFVKSFKKVYTMPLRRVRL